MNEQALTEDEEQMQEELVPQTLNFESATCAEPTPGNFKSALCKEYPKEKS